LEAFRARWHGLQARWHCVSAAVPRTLPSGAFSFLNPLVDHVLDHEASFSMADLDLIVLVQIL
jgi:hypothetical protein